jgi:hypothetical protein
VTAIGSGVIVNADVNASAAIDGTKISPDFGSQNVLTTGNLQGASINGGPLAGFRNAIINGNFDIWQRGTSSSGFGYVAADRWLNATEGSACTMSRLSWAVGDNTTGSNPKFLCRMAVTSVAGAANFVQLAQRIEGVQTFSGQQVTYSFWAKADANKTIAVDFNQNFGTGGSPSAAVGGIGAAKHNLTTSWQKITGTVSVSSVGGKTLGSGGNDMLIFRIWFDAGSDFNSNTDTLGQQSGTFDIAQVQIEPGPVATPFERRPIGTELALCQRYFCKTFNQDVAPATNTGDRRGALTYTYGAAGGFRTQWTYPVEMRAVPTLAGFNPNAANGSWRDINNNADYSSVASVAIGTRQTDVGSASSAGFSTVYMIHVTASAEL